MSKSRASWGFEVSDTELRAVRVQAEGRSATVTDFAVVPFITPLSDLQSEQHRADAISTALEEFKARHRPGRERIVVGAAANRAFCRFAVLPPVVPSRIPDIAKFEAMQQIPFPLDRVEWDYHTFPLADSTNLPVVIAAMSKERVAEVVNAFSMAGATPDVLAPEPFGIFNAMMFLGKSAPTEIWISVGARSTDIIINNRGDCWIRTFPLGTRELNAAGSEAEDFIPDVTRSVGYYASMNRNFKPERVVLVGWRSNDMRIMRALEKSLGASVVSGESFSPEISSDLSQRLAPGDIDRMLVSFGLALQGVELAQVNLDLLPEPESWMTYLRTLVKRF